MQINCQECFPQHCDRHATLTGNEVNIMYYKYIILMKLQKLIKFKAANTQFKEFF